MPKAMGKIYVDHTEEELLKMKKSEATTGLTDQEILFCEKYVHSRNVKTAAVNAGYDAKHANFKGWQLRQKKKVARYIAWLKARVTKECQVTAMDIIDMYMRIAFADVTEAITIDKFGHVKVKESSLLDGQIIRQVKEGKDGVTIELENRMEALNKLEKYFDFMPSDWRKQIETRKVELMEARLEIDKIKVLGSEEVGGDDGFIEALKESATEVWEDEVKD